MTQKNFNGFEGPVAGGVWRGKKKLPIAMSHHGEQKQRRKVGIIGHGDLFRQFFEQHYAIPDSVISLEFSKDYSPPDELLKSTHAVLKI